MGFKTRVGLEDWQRRNVPQSTGKFEESKTGNSRRKRKKIKKKFLQQYDSRRTMEETAQEYLQKGTQIKMHPGN